MPYSIRKAEIKEPAYINTYVYNYISVINNVTILSIHGMK